MSKEQYVSYEVAKLLKEKGFDWPCICYYEDNGIIHEALDYVRQNDGDDDDNDECLCPTQQMACRWLREEKGIHICGEIYKDCSEDADGNIVDEWTYWGWSFYWLPSGNIGMSSETDEFGSYEEAIEAGIQYCLKNIIK